jgi:MFS family permease
MDVTEKKISIFSLPVIVAALGYFVDIYDLLLFTIVKKTSMLGVGSTEATLLVDSTRVINWQMTGLLLGGIIWGVLADKNGRLSVLFGSIILYSTANFATGFVTTVDQYAWARFIGGLGLAGELGAGITLVSELLPKNKRGVGTSLVAGIGLFGAVAAYYTYQYTQDWRLCYKIGGVLGICLLLLRVKVAESGMFATAKASEVVKGNFFMLINNGKRFKKYFVAILIGLPTWYVIGILLNQSDRFGKAMFNSTTIDSGRAIMFGYVGIAIGDILIGLVSQYFKSRKKALLLFYGLTMLGLLFYYSNYNNSDTTMYLVAGWLGFSTGFWAIFVTMGAEQFGTNLRATAATTIPNMVRGALPLMNMLFLDLFQKSWHWSIVYSGIITGIIVMCVAFTAYAFTEETFHKDLDYMELD